MKSGPVISTTPSRSIGCSTLASSTNQSLYSHRMYCPRRPLCTPPHSISAPGLAVLHAELSNGQISPACLFTITARDAAPTRAAVQNAHTQRPSAGIPDAANTAATSPAQCGRAQYPVLEVESDG